VPVEDGSHKVELGSLNLGEFPVSWELGGKGKYALRCKLVNEQLFLRKKWRGSIPSVVQNSLEQRKRASVSVYVP
jgi:hypothetical protein